MLVEIHMLQNHAPSNLNRDDTGSPKECVFGGSLRARISSQCLKRSVRRSPLFESDLQGHIGTRTRRLPQLIEQRLRDIGAADEVVAAIGRKATELGSGKPSDHGETRQLIFVDLAEIPGLASTLKEIYDSDGPAAFARLTIEDDSRLTGQLPRSIDIALFGRMTTSNAFQDLQASLQVAHALSTHKIEKQYDYFTAVDDLLKPTEEPGAGMIGDVEFNSATYYKYFSLDWDALVSKLGDDRHTALLAVGALLRAAALTTPSGKQNTFAAHNVPDLILVEIKRENVPVSYANAFLKPVRASTEQDLVEASIDRLSRYAVQVKNAYGLNPLASRYLSVRGDVLEGSERVGSLDELVSHTRAALASHGSA